MRWRGATEIAHFLVVLTPHPIAFERDTYGVEQGLLAHRLGEEFDRARLHGFHGHQDITIASEEDDRDVDVGIGQLGLFADVEVCAAAEGLT